MHLATFICSRGVVLVALLVVGIGGACSSSSSKATTASGATTTTTPVSGTTTVATTGTRAQVDVTATGALKFHLRGTTARCQTSPGLPGHTVISIELDKASYPQVGTVLSMDNEIVKWLGPNGTDYIGDAAPGSFKQHPISVKLTNLKMTAGTKTVTLNGSVVCAA